MNSSRITPNSNSSIFSSQSIGQGFIRYIRDHEKQSPALDKAIDFVSSSVFLSSFGSSSVIKLINHLISKYPAYSYSLERLIKSLMKSPLYFRITDLINKLPEELIRKLDVNPNEPILSSFSITNAETFTDINSIPTFTSLESKSPIVSLSDVFNEKAKEIIDSLPKQELTQSVEKYTKLSSCLSQILDQFQPLSVFDIADFISNLVSPNSIFIDIKSDRDYSNDRNVLSLLRPFKNQTKMSVEDLVTAFDRVPISIRSQTSFQLFINCIKEVTNARSIPAYPFFGKWQHPLTQLNFITYLINSNTMSLTLPKPAQIPHLNNVVVGDFKNEIWKCPEFIETLAYLYDSSETGVDQILGESLEKGPTLLLLVLALNPKVSRFATHLVRLLLLSPNQYMPGFSALWAANDKFFIDLVTALYEEQHILLGRFLDLIDDLAVFDSFTQKCSLKMSILLYITAFFRRSFNFQEPLLKLYENDKENTLNICFNIIENPVEYGFSTDHNERKISKDEIVSSDLVFFRFINDIYSSFNASLKQRVNALFDKCIARSSDLTRYTFLWRKKKEPPMSPKSPTPAKESDFIELATATEQRGISRYNIIVNSLLNNFPKEKNDAQSKGKTLGKLLSRDLLSKQSTTQALKMIDQGLHQRENTAGFIFAIASLDELKDNFDLFMPFTKHILQQKEFQKHAPALYKAALKASSQPEINIHKSTQIELKNRTLYRRQKFFNDYNEEKDNNLRLYELKIKKLEIPPCLERFKYVKISTDRMKHENIPAKNKSNWDTLALYYMKMQTMSMQISYQMINNCIEAAIYLVYEYLNSPNCRSNKTICTLTRLGRWLGLNTLNKNKPIYSRLLDIPKLLLFGYTNSALCTVIPFVYALFENASPIFKPPNPWTVSILSILGSFARIPYLNYSLYSLINKLFNNFNVSLNDIEPYPIRRLKIEYITTSDFFYPPLDFTSSLTMVSEEKLLNGDFFSLLHVVQEHLIIGEEYEKIRSGIVREIGFFIYTKMSNIANTASITAFDLVLKDFARCQDPIVVDRHARALLHQYVNALSMMSVSLFAETSFPNSNLSLPEAIHKNSRWIDQLVRQLSYSLGLQTLLGKLQPIQKLRASWNSNTGDQEQNEGNGQTCNININANSISISTSSNSNNTNKDNDNIGVGFGGYCGSSEYWDVKSFPPSIAQRIPMGLWPPNIQNSFSSYTRKVDSDSLVPTGLYECFNVGDDIRHVYGNLSLNPLPLSAPDIYPNELQFIPSIANWIFSLFVTDRKTGQITSVMNPKQYFSAASLTPIQIVATIIYCFPPNITKPASNFGVDLVRHYFGHLQKDQMQLLQPQVHPLLWNCMPDLSVFSEMVKMNLVAPNFFEIIAMHFIDQPISRNCDFSPLVSLSLSLLQAKQLYPHSIERLMSFLCTCSNNESKDNMDKKEYLDKDSDGLDKDKDKDNEKDNENADNENENDQSDYNYNYHNNQFGKGQKNYKNNDINELTRKWHSYQNYEENSHTIISKMRHDQNYFIFDSFDQQIAYGLPQVTEFIKNMQDKLKLDKFWEELVIISFPDKKNKLLRFLYASLSVFNYEVSIFQYFLIGTFNAISNKKISLNYFATIMANVTLQLRSQFAKLFGGFLNDMKPIKADSNSIGNNIHCQYPYRYQPEHPELFGAWLFIFPLVVQQLLIDEQFYLPTSLLVVVMLNILARFPLNWGDYNEYRKCYKAILRIILLIIHDAPKFVRGYYFDFISAIPIHFRKLRNIILSCGNTLQSQKPNGQNDRFILSKFANYPNERLNRILAVGYFPNELLNELLIQWGGKASFSLIEVGQALIYIFKCLFLNDQQFDENSAKNSMNLIVKTIVSSATNLRNAITVVETLFDMLRFDCKQTRVFNEILVFIFNKLDLNWDSVSIQEIIFTVLMQRSFGIQPVPFGVSLLRSSLEQNEEFKRLLLIFKNNVSNS